MIETERLTLRPWCEADAEPFAAICADPEVMRHLDGPQTLEQVDALIQRRHADQHDTGHCFRGVEERNHRSWRLRRDARGRGYAREAASASIAWGRRETTRPRIAAWTVQANEASWRLMGRLGMRLRPDLAFAHPAFPDGDPLRHLIVHAIGRPA